MEREEYIEELADRKYDYQKVVFRNEVPIDRMFTQARARLWAFQEYKEIYTDCTIYFHITNQDRILKMDYKISLVEEVSLDAKLEQPYIKLSMDSTLFSMLLINHMSWNMADAFIDYERVPNVYNQQAYVLLNHLRI